MHTGPLFLSPSFEKWRPRSRSVAVAREMSPLFEKARHSIHYPRIRGEFCFPLFFSPWRLTQHLIPFCFIPFLCHFEIIQWTYVQAKSLWNQCSPWGELGLLASEANVWLSYISGTLIAWLSLWTNREAPTSPSRGQVNVPATWYRCAHLVPSHALTLVTNEGRPDYSPGNAYRQARWRPDDYVKESVKTNRVIFFFN